MSQNFRKRVVLKVWQKDGQVYDTASHVEWLERQGWAVACAEPLLDDPANGVAYVSYLLEWKDGTTVPPNSIPPKAARPATSAGLQPNTTKTVQCPTNPNTAKVILLAHVTRGGMRIHDLDSKSILVDLATVPERGPQAGQAEFSPEVNAGLIKQLRQFLIVCQHDAEPAPLSSTDLPDASPGVLTLDACFVRTDETQAKLVELVQQQLRPGDLCNFHVVFKFI